MASGTPLKRKSYLLTWYYPADKHSALEVFKTLVDEGKLRYAVINEELAPDPDPVKHEAKQELYGPSWDLPLGYHLQGYIHLAKLNRITAIKKWFPAQGIDFTPITNGTEETVEEYCSKDCTRVPGTETHHYGERPVTSGKRTDIDAFKQDVEDGASWKDLVKTHTRLIQTSQQGCKEIYKVLAPRVVYTVPTLNHHPMHDVINDFIAHPDDRKVLFLVDPAGGVGKTTYAKHMYNSSPTVEIIKPGKGADMAHFVKDETTTFILDCPRSRTENIPIPYEFLEGLKDGAVWSPKYDSHVKRVKSPNTVIVLTNHSPDHTRLSLDRIIVKYVTKEDIFDTRLVSNSFQALDKNVSATGITPYLTRLPENHELKEQRERDDERRKRSELLSHQYAVSKRVRFT